MSNMNAQAWCWFQAGLYRLIYSWSSLKQCLEYSIYQFFCLCTLLTTPGCMVNSLRKYLMCVWCHGVKCCTDSWNWFVGDLAAVIIVLVSPVGALGKLPSMQSLITTTQKPTFHIEPWNPSCQLTLTVLCGILNHRLSTPRWCGGACKYT